MNPPSKADTTSYAAPVADSAGGNPPNGYAPSVPLSVYRDLSTELQSSKARVDTLNRQNKQLSRQNQALRHEIQRFVHSAEQLGHFAGVLNAEEAHAVETKGLDAETDFADAVPSATVSAPGTIPGGRGQSVATVPQDRPEAPSARKPRLFTEQPEMPRRLSKGKSRPQDLSNLWLATTILLVIFTAFGAGFLIMRPLLNR
jgi:hypothetical protein